LPQRKSDRKLQLILERAAGVFARKGFEGASMRDLSRATGISLAGLYHYVSSKQQLLHRIQMDAFSRILARLESRLEGVRDPEGRIRILIRNHLDYFLTHPVEMKVFTHEAEALQEPYRGEVAGIKRRYYELALKLFRDLQHAGRARSLEPRVAVLALFGMMNWIYTWHRPETDPDAQELAEVITGIFLRGALASSNKNGDSALTSLRKNGHGNGREHKHPAREVNHERKHAHGHA
jgi:AcrR family transcriptional regulator